MDRGVRDDASEIARECAGMMDGGWICICICIKYWYLVFGYGIMVLANTLLTHERDRKKVEHEWIRGKVFTPV